MMMIGGSSPSDAIYEFMIQTFSHTQNIRIMQKKKEKKKLTRQWGVLCYQYMNWRWCISKSETVHSRGADIATHDFNAYFE